MFNAELFIKKRKEKGITQEELAKFLGYKSKSMICMIEKGNVKNITTDFIIKVKGKFKLSEREVKEIFGV